MEKGRNDIGTMVYLFIKTSLCHTMYKYVLTYKRVNIKRKHKSVFYNFWLGKKTPIKTQILKDRKENENFTIKDNINKL